MRIATILVCFFFSSFPILAEISAEKLSVESFKGSGPYGILIDNIANRAEILDADESSGG